MHLLVVWWNEMTIVNAYQIVDKTTWVRQALGGYEDYIDVDYSNAVVKSKNGDRKYAPFPSEFSWEVGDWVVLWPNGFKNIQPNKSFPKHFKHLDGVRYETDLQPLF